MKICIFDFNFLVMHEPTKKDKKILRQAIEIGAQKDYASAIIALSEIIDKWKAKKIDNGTAYQSLFNTMRKHDKRIGQMYNSMTGSDYLRIAGVLLADEKVTEADFEGLSDESMAVLYRWKQVLDS